MKRNRDSLLVRVPLLATTLVILTALLTAGALGALTRRYLIEDVDAGASQAVAAWAKSLPPMIQQDNVWGVFEALKAVTDAGPANDRSIAVVLDRSGHIFASSDPRRFPTDRLPQWSPLWRPGTLSLAQPAGAGALEPGRGPPIHSGHWRVYNAALRDNSGATVGTLVYAVGDRLYWSRLRAMLLWISAITVVAVCLFVPVVWRISRSMLDPLARLGGSMATDSAQARRVGETLAARRDEVGALSRAFLRLLAGLEHSRQTEKFAAVGTLAAATAHEINNPLGGMINAVQTARRFGRYDDTTGRTLELLGRGLEQLRTIAQALLAQTRPAERDLNRQDLRDLSALITPCRQEREVGMDENLALPESIALAAGPVRQATLNILLNACHAAERGTTLQFSAEITGSAALRITVRNQGSAPPASAMGAPGVSATRELPGLGLWESRRLLSDIGGTLRLSHERGWTSAVIEIPLRALQES
jgi:signal transduction histidine kinase